MKKQTVVASLLLVGVLGIGLVSCMQSLPYFSQKQVSYVDGTYRGTAMGMMGDLTVEVVVENQVISSITLKNHKETDGIYQKAEKGVIEAILQAQNTEVDAVAGATKTSDGIKAAVDAALKEAVEK